MLKRTADELVGFLYRDNDFPQGCVLLTGTGIVPPDEFTLQQGDEIAIAIPPIGTLRTVVQLGGTAAGVIGYRAQRRTNTLRRSSYRIASARIARPASANPFFSKNRTEATQARIRLGHDALDVFVTECPADECFDQLAVPSPLVRRQDRIPDFRTAARVWPAREAALPMRRRGVDASRSRTYYVAPANTFRIAGNRIGEPAQRARIVERRRPSDRRARAESSPPVRIAGRLRVCDFRSGCDEIQSRRRQRHHAF